MKRLKNKIKLPVRAYLLYLLLATFLITGVTFSKYVTKSSGGDKARVVAINDISLTETGDFGADGSLMIIPGVDIEKKAMTHFGGSETATCLFIEIELSNHWKMENNRDFVIKNGSTDLMCWSVDTYWTFLKNDENKYVFYKEMEPNQTCSKDIIADNGKIEVSRYITETDLSAMEDVQIALQSIVVQMSGNETIEQAWQLVRGGE